MNIAIVNDVPMICTLLTRLIQNNSPHQVIWTAENGAVAVDKAMRDTPDLILMDLIMPGMDGVEATRQVKNISPHTQIVVLTSYHEDEHIFPALQAGALSYVLKDVKMEELAEAVRKAARGEPSLHPQVAARVIQELRGARKDELNPFVDLTNREIEILRLIAGGLNNRTIAGQLVISEYTVKGHVSNILSKLHLADRTQAAVYAWQKGIVRRS